MRTRARAPASAATAGRRRRAAVPGRPLRRRRPHRAERARARVLDRGPDRQGGRAGRRRGRAAAQGRPLRQGRRPALRLHLGLDQVHARLRSRRVAVLPGRDARGRRGPALHRAPDGDPRLRGHRQRRPAGAGGRDRHRRGDRARRAAGGHLRAGPVARSTSRWRPSPTPRGARSAPRGPTSATTAPRCRPRRCAAPPIRRPPSSAAGSATTTRTTTRARSTTRTTCRTAWRTCASTTRGTWSRRCGSASSRCAARAACEQPHTRLDTDFIRARCHEWNVARSETSPLRRTFPVPGGPPVRLRLAGPSDRAPAIALLQARGLPADELDVRRLLAFDPARRHVLCALAPLDGGEVLAGIGAIDFGAEAPDVLVIDERFARPGRRARRACWSSARAHAAPRSLPRMQLEARSPATGERLGAVDRARPPRTCSPPPPAPPRRSACGPRCRAPARARYVRRAARLMLDDLDELALLLARETGRPRTEAALGELLPAVAGLSDLADDGPAALADRRLGRPALLRAGRRAVGVQEPRGVVGVLGVGRLAVDGARAGGGRLAAGRQRRRARPRRAAGRRAAAAALLRAGIPGELLAVVHGDAARAALPARARGSSRSAAGDAKARCWCSRARRSSRSPRPRCGPRSRGRAPPGRRRAPRLRAVGRRAAARAAARARAAAGGRRPRRASRRRSARCARPKTSRRSRRSSRRRSPAARSWSAAARSASRDCAARSTRPPCCGACPPARGSCASRAPGPVLAVVEAPGEAAAIELVQDRPTTGDRRARGGVVSVWARDRAKGERVARTLEAELTWVNEHGAVAPGPALRLQRHVVARQVASRPARSAQRAPAALRPGLVRARTAVTRLVHGREADRLRCCAATPAPLARAALRVGSGLLRRR